MTFIMDIVKKKYDARLLFTVTDSLVYEIKGKDDVYEKIYSDKDLFDFSDYLKNNKKVIGKMKDELSGEAISEFVGLKSKMYSLISVDDEEKIRAKGVNKKLKQSELLMSKITKSTTNLLRKLHNDVETEPELQPITTERLRCLSNDQCKPDIRARGVWRDAQNAYFDIRVTNISSESQKHLSIRTILMKHEKEKKRSYNSHIMNVEHRTFTLLVFSVLGAEGPETSSFHRYIATKIASKTEERYEKVLSLIRCKLSFLILKSALMCIRGSCPFDRESVTMDDFSLSCDAARL